MYKKNCFHWKNFLNVAFIYIYNNLRKLVKWKAICSWFELLLLLTFNEILFIKKHNYQNQSQTRFRSSRQGLCSSGSYSFSRWRQWYCCWRHRWVCCGSRGRGSSGCCCSFSSCYKAGSCLRCVSSQWWFWGGGGRYWNIDTLSGEGILSLND